MNAACESFEGSKTSLNSNNGAVESGCAIDDPTMKKCNKAKNNTTSSLPMTFLVISAFGSKIINNQNGCGPNVANANAVWIGSGETPTISITALRRVHVAKVDADEDGDRVLGRVELLDNHGDDDIGRKDVTVAVANVCLI
jgi:hypothetical protein